MKSRIICLCLCVVALGVSMLMTVKLINSEEIDPPVISSDKDKTPSSEQGKGDKNGLVALTNNAISSFADKTEAFVEALAYGEKKEYKEELSYIIENLDSISSHLASDKVGDKEGSEYLASLSSSLKMAKEGFVNDRDFSQRVSTALLELENKKNALTKDNSSFYPDIDTDANGALTLALLSVYEDSLSADADTFTVTVTGGALMGDRLGTTAGLKFSDQLDKHKYLYPFYKISAFTLRDDLTLSSLEAPLTTATDSESFNPSKGSPDYAKRLLGIDAVSLASSAIMDYGEKGFDETVKALRENGISYSVQEGSQSVNSDFGKVVYITFDLTDTPVTDEQKERNKEVIKNAVEAERTNGADLVIVLLHWNTRQRKADSLSSDYLGTAISVYEPHFDAYNKEIARAAIGNGVSGADLVVGYGSRVAQGIESYNNKFIVYETGDLTYSGALDEEQKNTNYSFIFRQTFVKDGSAVKSLSYRIIPIVNTSEDNLYLPTPVFDERAEEIIENLVYQSRYFSNAITDFNYIKIEK